MSKDKISDYSQTANSNTDIGGINVDEGCAPSGINDAIRTLMKQLKDWQSGSQDVYIHPAGSASAPSITATGDTNTGVFFPAADTVGITTGGTERARVDSSGNLGLGVTPSAWQSIRKAIQVGDTSSLVYGNNQTTLGNNVYINSSGQNTYIKTGAYAQMYIHGSGGEHIWFNAPSGTAGNAITFTQAMTLDASGNLGLAASSITPRDSGATTFELYGPSSGRAAIKFTNSTSGTGATDGMFLGYDSSLNFNILNNEAGAILFGTSNTERARIDSSGNLLVGTTSALGSAPFCVKGPATAGQQQVSLHNPATSGTRYFMAFGTEGTYTERGYITWNGSTMALSNASDERLKENIVDAPSALPKIAQMQIRSFDFKEDGRHVDYGVIAQELNQVIPSAVFEGADNEDGSINKPWSVGLEPVIPVLVKAIQELKAIVDAQAAEIAALKG